MVDKTGFVSLAVTFVYPILGDGLNKIEGMFAQKQLTEIYEANVAVEFPWFTRDV